MSTRPCERRPEAFYSSLRGAKRVPLGTQEGQLEKVALPAPRGHSCACTWGIEAHSQCQFSTLPNWRPRKGHRWALGLSSANSPLPPPPPRALWARPLPTQGDLRAELAGKARCARSPAGLVSPTPLFFKLLSILSHLRPLNPTTGYLRPPACLQDRASASLRGCRAPSKQCCSDERNAKAPGAQSCPQLGGGSSSPSRSTEDRAVPLPVPGVGLGSGPPALRPKCGERWSSLTGAGNKTSKKPRVLPV